MSVDIVLGGKGREVVTVRPDATVGDAAAILHRHRIGAVVVAGPEGGVAGILSERDIVKAIATEGASALTGTVASRMTERVVTCRRDSTVDELMGVMTDGKFRHVPVVEDGRLVGIVSIGDLVKHRLAAIEAEHRAMRDYILTA